MITNPSFLSTALPYVNGSPHVGHAQEFVIADAVARHRRRLGHTVHFQSGTDDNSLKSARAAITEGLPIRELVARHAKEFEALAASLDVRFDDFVRTSEDPRHAPAVVRLWRACAASGDIYRRSYTGLYCAGCEQFFGNGDLPGNRCPEHSAPLESVTEENYFFRASRYRDTIREAIESGALGIEPAVHRREALRLAGTLEDFSISRSAVRAHGWGIPVPEDPEQVVYVWFDALANYVSALGYGTGASDFERKWNQAASRTHVIGKGILRFHAAYWPAILLSAGLALPTEILVHGYLTSEGRKIGKSLGNAREVRPLVERYGADAFRYYALARLDTRADTDFAESRLVAAHDDELADQLGNLLSRTLALVAREFEGRIPFEGPHTEADLSLRNEGQVVLADSFAGFGAFDLGAAAAAPLRLVAAANRYVDVQAPWALRRRGERLRLGTVLHLALEAALRATWLLEPLIPRAAGAILGAASSIGLDPDGTWTPLRAGSTIHVGAPAFPKLRPKANAHSSFFT